MKIPGVYFSYNNIVAAIRRIPTQHTFLIVDSCYSGAILVQDTRSNSQRDPREDDPSRWILASGRNEVVPDGRAGGNSPFSEQLLDVLNRYADKGIAVLSLVDKVTTATIHNGKQKPIGRPLYNAGDKGGQFVFHPRGTVHATATETNSPKVVREHIYKARPATPTTRPTLLHRLQKLPSWVWIVVPALLIPGLYWGISQLGKSGAEINGTHRMLDSTSRQSTLALQEGKSDSISSFSDVLDQSASAENPYLLSGESGLNDLQHLHDSVWTGMRVLLKGIDFQPPDLKRISGTSRLMSENLISQQAYYTFLFVLHDFGYATEGWTDFFSEITKSPREFQEEDRALMNVSWYGAKAYCYWLSSVSKQNFRLPESNEIKSPLMRKVEWYGNEESGEKGYFPDSKKPQIDKYRKPFLSRDIGFRIIRD